MATSTEQASQIDGMPWPAFETFFAERWQPGQHVALVGPTGMGKTTMAGAILPLRKYVLALDPKGGDSTLGALEKRGFERIDHWVDRFEKHGPPRSVREKIGNGEPARLIVSHAHRTADDFVKLKALLLQVLNAAFEQGGWTFYMDELQVACDMMGLKKDMERLLIASRDRGVSVVSSFQSPPTRRTYAWTDAPGTPARALVNFR